MKVYYLIDAERKSYESAKVGKYGGHRKLKIYGCSDCPLASQYIAKNQYVK